MEPVQAGHETASQRSAYFYRRGLEFIAGSPVRYLGLMAKKTWLFWSGVEIKRNLDIYYAREYSALLATLLWDRGVSFPFGLVAPLSLLGLAWTWSRRDPELGLLRLYVLTYSASVILFFVTARYRMPVVPVLLLFAAEAVRRLAGSGRAGDLPVVAARVVPLSLLVLLLNLRAAPDPDRDAQLHHDIGEAHLRKGSYEPATSRLQRAVELEPDYASAHHNLAAAHLYGGNPGSALDHASRALEINPRRADTRVILAEALLARERVWEAENELRQVVDLDVHPGSADYHLGRLLLKRGQYRNAVPLLTAASSWEPDSFWVRYDLGRAYYGSGNLDSAWVCFRQAHELEPDRPQSLAALGAIHLVKGELADARHYLGRALALDSSNPEVRINLAQLCLQERHPHEAIGHLTAALETAPDPVPVLQQLIRAHLAAGDSQTARTLANELHAPDPGLPPQANAPGTPLLRPSSEGSVEGRITVPH